MTRLGSWVKQFASEQVFRGEARRRTNRIVVGKELERLDGQGRLYRVLAPDNLIIVIENALIHPLQLDEKPPAHNDIVAGQLVGTSGSTCQLCTAQKEQERNRHNEITPLILLGCMRHIYRQNSVIVFEEIGQ